MYRVKISLIVIIVGLMLIPQFLLSRTDKMKLVKTERQSKIKSHPYENLLSAQKGLIRRSDTKSNAFQNVLVLLVDFQQDEDANTTGNGKFDLTNGLNYPIALGSPPHNLEFYETHMEAMKYYYRAASFEQYDMNYSVYPKNKSAYTLPQKMSYYNPGIENQDLFMSRVEEYFQSVFAEADKDTSIVFSNYEHYIIIHAGSDWQHDINSDTPGDLPSFFIKVGTGKEAIVDGGFTINYACNVPETITQDMYRTDYDDGSSDYSGYGVINSVLSHEFGHSLGFADLYNVVNHNPAVGLWDIMDSGGTGVMQLEVTEDTISVIYNVEGATPVLPGAFSRCLVWGEDFKRMGLLKEISDMAFDKELELQASDFKQVYPKTVPVFYKIPLNQNEYILLENKNLDPDGDGGTAFLGALGEGPHSRVILYPASTIQGLDDPTYEYDWMLPGFRNTSYSYEGCGLLIWHVDDNILYNQGSFNSEGEFVSNFANNQINTAHDKRGVSVIEADNMDDVGNPYSLHWLGTAYDPFFKNKPSFNADGLFVDWSSEIFNDSLSAVSRPKLVAHDGTASEYCIHSISNPQRIMKFRISSMLFDKTEKIAEVDTLQKFGQVCQSDTLLVPIMTGNSMIFKKHVYQLFEDNWKDLYIKNNPIIDESSQIKLLNKLEKTYYYYSNKTISYLNPTTQILSTLELPQRIIRDPEVYQSNGRIYLFASSEDKLYRIDVLAGNWVEYSTSRSRPIVVESKIYSFEPNTVKVFSNDKSLLNSYSIPEQIGNYQPICVYDSLRVDKSFILCFSDQGNLYRFDLLTGQFSKIFTNYTGQKPSQFSVYSDNGSIVIVFGLDSRIFKIYSDGTNTLKSPASFSGKQIQAGSALFTVELRGAKYTWVKTVTNDYLCLNAENQIDYSKAINNLNIGMVPEFGYESIGNRLYFFYLTNKSVYVSFISNIMENPILWNGEVKPENMTVKFRWGSTQALAPISVYAYPNPCSKEDINIRVQNHKGDLKLELYNISGKRVLERSLANSGNTTQEIKIPTKNLSSGVYFGIVKSAGETKKVTIAIEK